MPLPLVKPTIWLWEFLDCSLLKSCLKSIFICSLLWPQRILLSYSFAQRMIPSLCFLRLELMVDFLGLLHCQGARL